MAWKKLLYLRQPYPDNYTHQSFLDQLKRNTAVSNYPFRRLFYDFSLIGFYGSLLLLVNVNFTAIYAHGWDPMKPTAVSTIVSILGLVVDAARGNAHHIKAYVVILVFLLLVSPVLQSLTRLTSSDSIWALSCILSCLSLVCHDYSLHLLMFRPVKLLNLNFANGIVLASRLSSSAAVFCFLVFSIEVSVMVPLLDYRLRQILTPAHWALCVAVVLVLCGELYVMYGWVLVLLYLAALLSLLTLLPTYFLFLQRYKNELQGPWDTAKPKLNN